MSKHHSTLHSSIIRILCQYFFGGTVDKNKNENKFWLALGKNTRIGSATFSEILSINKPFSEIFYLPEEELITLKLSNRTVKEILFCQTNYNPDKIYDEYEKREIKFLKITDDNYPKMLREIYDPPALLYYKGEIQADSVNLAIVGSRKVTNYGVQATYDIAKYLANNQVCVVSGMAIGVDTIAHQATVDSHGKTIAVLGCGLDQIYPSRNVQLAKKIIEEGGAIITEKPIGVPPLRYNFPQRNRIISGLSLGVIITEATEKSGSLITATSALEQNREIFALPGSIYNLNSKGPNNLIRMGAKIITKPQDILEEIGVEITGKEKVAPKGANDEESSILTCLESEPKHIDTIIKETGLPQTKVSTTLTLMEISEKVKHAGGMVYRINY